MNAMGLKVRMSDGATELTPDRMYHISQTILSTARHFGGCRRGATN